MMEHTKEPWSIGKPPPNGEQTIGDSKGLMVAVATTGYGVSSEANARRIVACVNACAGIPTEQLKSGEARSVRDELANIATLEKQRDELLADAERYRFIRHALPKWYGGKVKWIGGSYSCDEIDEIIDAAIANAKG